MLAPVSQEERISSLDVLRGTALLGIALMNIVFSALPISADFNPNVAGGKTGLNLFAILAKYIFFDGKMRGIFSLMFGAGCYYFIMRGVRRGVGLEAASLYYRRILWLLVFGLVHAYLIWHGDILYPYALLGLILFPLLELRPKTLLIVAAVMVVAMTGVSVGHGFETRETHQLAMEADRAEAAHKPLSDKQKEAKRSWEDTRQYINPTEKQLKEEREMYLGSYLHLLEKRASIVMKWHSQAFYMSGWDMLTMMLIGIAFAKLDVLTGARSWAFYRNLVLWGWGLGLPIGAITAFLAYRVNFEPTESFFVFSTYQVARVLTTLGHMSAILMICKAGLLRGLTSRLAAVGQMAFSNYIAHSIIYGLVFYGYGFALFGKLQRYQIYGVVLCMWIFSLIVSPIWMRHYRYGPLEWVWRSLTYWQRQPMRISQPQPVETLEAVA